MALAATATDPNPGHTVTYSLDPGAPAGATINPTSGLFVWTPPNVQSFYSISIRATDSGTQGLSAAQTLSVLVFDVPPTINAGINASIDQGTEFVRTGSFVDPNPDTWTATVDYGDGSGAQPLALNPDKTFQLDHTYATPGDYVVGVTIIDSQGAQGHGYFSLQVQPASTPGTTSTPGGTTQGQPLVVTIQSSTTGNSTANETKGHPLKHAKIAKAKHPRVHIPTPAIHVHKHH